MRCFKRSHCEKLCCERTSQFTFVFTFSVVVVDLPTDCILSFLFPAETDVLVPVFSQTRDVVVVNSVVVLKFPIYTVSIRSTPEVRYCHYFRAVSLLITKYSCGVMTYRIIFIREPSNYESFGDSFFAALQQFRMTRHPV